MLSLSRTRTREKAEYRSPDDDVRRQNHVAFMNDALRLLNEVFPDVEVEVLRGMLSTFSEESRVQLVTDALLRRDCKEALGRRTRERLRKLDPWEMFRSEDYIAAVKATLKSEFKGLQSSSINAVLAENNYDYARSRTTLLEIAAKSWRFSISSWFRGKKQTLTSIPPLRTTGCRDLDDEIFKLTNPLRETQIAEDTKVARLLDEAEHAAASELVECETCYSEVTWNEIAACTKGHFVCYGCLIRGVQEGIYGQSRSISEETTSILCLSAAAAPCDASVPRDILEKALPIDLRRNLDEKLATNALERSGLKAVRCPFCTYAEVDDAPAYQIRTDAHTLAKIFALMSLFGGPLLILSIAHILLVVLLLAPVRLFFPDSIDSHALSLVPIQKYISAALSRVRQKRNGQVFKCRSETCGRPSCVNCLKEWEPFHQCFADNVDAARIYIERAMADAVKRTCPECHISFVKSDGCNKLTCVCGYIMCYICRADIRKEMYGHFCNHFRVIPGSACNECDKCDLYAQEDETAVTKAAAARAEEEYFRDHVRPTTWDHSRRKIGPNNDRRPSSRGNLNYIVDEVPKNVNALLEAPRTLRNLFDDMFDQFLDDILEL